MVGFYSYKGKFLQLLLNQLIWYHLALKLSVDMAGLGNNEKKELFLPLTEQQSYEKKELFLPHIEQQS